MSMSSVFVVTNALRLRKFKPRGVYEKSGESSEDVHESDHVSEDKSVSGENKEEAISNKNKDEAISDKKDNGREFQTIKVDGMSCAHCEKRVEDALKNTGKVDSVKADAKTGEVKFINLGINKNEVKSAIDSSGYKLAEDTKGEMEMEKILKIDGMSCNHCVATVKKALESVDGVTNAEVSLDEKQAVVTGKADSKELVEAVEDAGYEAQVL